MIEKDTKTKKIYTVKYNELTTYAVEVRGASSSKEAIDFVKENGECYTDNEEGVSSGNADYCYAEITGNYKSSVERVRQCKGVGMAFKSQGNPDRYWVRTCRKQEVTVNEPVSYSVSTETGWVSIKVDYNGFCHECNRMLHADQNEDQRHEMTLLWDDSQLGHYWRDNEGKMHYPCGFPEDKKEALQ
jgi:hypothetical protein